MGKVPALRQPCRSPAAQHPVRREDELIRLGAGEGGVFAALFSAINAPSCLGGGVSVGSPCVGCGWL